MCHKRQFIFIVKEQFKDLFHLRIGSSIFINYTDQENILSGEKNLLHTLQQNKFDIIVDLNPKFQLAISRFISFIEFRNESWILCLISRIDFIIFN